MRSAYTLAVYGKLRSTFIISASQSKYPLISLQDDIGLKNSQFAYETKMYKFESDLVEDSADDIRAKLIVSSGKCDMYVNTYN